MTSSSPGHVRFRARNDVFAKDKAASQPVATNLPMTIPAPLSSQDPLEVDSSIAAGAHHDPLRLKAESELELTGE
eukprot:2863869-Rhodomonas_salina.2